MDKFIYKIIYEQNKELLEIIADKKYNHEEDKEIFINKYHKKNYCKLPIKKRSKIQEYNKIINRVLNKKKINNYK